MSENDRLHEYRRKRDFARTAEPSGSGEAVWLEGEKGGGGVSAAEEGHG